MKTADPGTHVIFHYDLDQNRTFIIQYWRGELRAQILINSNGSSHDLNSPAQQIDAMMEEIKRQDVTRSLGSVSGQYSRMLLLPNENNEQFRQKMVGTVISDNSILAPDSVLVVTEFKRRGITLTTIVTCTLVRSIEDFYRQLTRNTIGRYILLADAPPVLSGAILRAFIERATLLLAFHVSRREDFPPQKSRVDNVCEALDQLGEQPEELGEAPEELDVQLIQLGDARPVELEAQFEVLDVQPIQLGGASPVEPNQQPHELGFDRVRSPEADINESILFHE